VLKSQGDAASVLPEASKSKNREVMQEFDYVVVGAGSAGGPVFARLTESGRHKVLLLEAGPADTNSWLHIPIGFSRTFLDPSVNWKFASGPEPHLGGRRVYWPRGKVLGGSSAINGMVYIRGLPSDYDQWRQMGNEGWSFDDCLPYFRRMEGHVLGDDELHGAAGPVMISGAEYRSALGDTFLQACDELGLQRNGNFNSGDQEGAGYYHVTSAGGRRSSTGTAYIAGSAARANATVVTGALVEGLEFEGSRVVGVRYRTAAGSTVARAGREVVMCAGTVGTPHLLQLSGIGPAALLRQHGIEVRRDLAGVGENLQDHYGVRSVYETWWQMTLNDDWHSLRRRFGAFLAYHFLRNGPMLAGPGFVGGFVRLMSQSAEPDTQIHFFPWSAERLDKGPDEMSGFTILVNQSRPESRGYVRLASGDPGAPPSIVANYLAADADQRAVVAGLKFVRSLSRTEALTTIITYEKMPGNDHIFDDEYLAFAREHGQSAYHPVGTCRMGRDPNAVVDPQLRVHGVPGLRIADASVMPTLVSGNTNAACMMIGEKAADLILKDAS
jgi:choline dehydrogenase